MSKHREAVAQALSKPLSLLVVADDQVVVDGNAVAGWDLPLPDRQVLARWGLPLLEECRLVPNLQEGASPGLSFQGCELYGLGLFADHEVGATRRDGQVWGIPLNGELPHSFINSSVSCFVETTWRWYWVWKQVKDLRFDIEQYDLLDDFLDFAITVDAEVGVAERSLWRGMIQSW